MTEKTEGLVAQSVGDGAVRRDGIFRHTATNSQEERDFRLFSSPH
ncbi:hypothetical protein [Prevotella lacticifex]|nr:hypothetical protein [Prevotella lacticifex]